MVTSSESASEGRESISSESFEGASIRDDCGKSEAERDASDILDLVPEAPRSKYEVKSETNGTHRFQSRALRMT